jgi:hypothetical protein
MGAKVFVKYRWSVAAVSLVEDDDHGSVLDEVDVSPRITWKESDEPALFRQFADLPEDPSVILAFARRYGLLLRRQLRFSNGKREPLAAWFPRVAWMRHMTTLYDLVLTRDTPLSRYVRHEGVGPSSVREPSLPGDHVPKRWRWRGRDWWTAERKEDDARTVAAYLDARINEELDRFGDRTQIGVTLEEGGGLLTLVDLSPRTLWECLVAQFWAAASNNLMHQRCGYCGRWITLTGPDRSDRTTCSPSCRTGLWRLRTKAKALYHNDSQPVAAIAKQLGRKESEIRDWIGGK